VLQNDPAVGASRAASANYQQVYIVRGLPVFSDDMAYNGPVRPAAAPVPGRRAGA
jgi:iron complex outermembrane receptor protein